MIYEERLGFDSSNAENEAIKYKFSNTKWFAYLLMAGFVSVNNMSMSQAMLTGTNIIPPDKNYSYLYGMDKIDKKNKEIEQIKEVIISKLGVDIVTHWLPETGMDRECLFFHCNLDQETLYNVEKYSKLEYDMYIAAKEIIDKSKYFDMVAMI